MAGSDITITALTATPTLRGTKLVATVNDPRDGAIPNLAADAVEFYSATVNNFASATKVVEGPGVASGDSEANHAGLIEEQTYYYWALVRNKIGSRGAKFPVSDTAGIQATAVGTAGLAFGLANGKLVASVASNALTIEVKTAAGNNPSADDPVYIAFRNVTLATGNYQIRSITAALSLVVSSGSTLDTSNNRPFRLWVLLFDDGGTLRLGVIKCVDVNRVNIYPINDNQLLSATAEGGAGAADSSGVVYANAAISSKPFRIVGYLEWSSGLATAGTWNVGPDIIRLHSTGMPKPGDQVQKSAASNNSTVLSNTTTIPFDNTLPQSSEGSAIAFWDVSLRPTSICNIVDYHASVSVSHHTGSCHIIGALFRDSEANAYVSDLCKINAADDVGKLLLDWRFFPDDLNSHTYKMRVGGSAAGTWTVNGINGASTLGGILPTLAMAQEIMT